MGRKKKEIILEGDIEKTDQKLSIGGLGDLVKSVTNVLGITTLKSWRSMAYHTYKS